MPGELDEHLELWEAARARGEPISLDDLCADWPEGRAELARCIRLLQSCDRLLDLDTRPADSAHSATPTAGPHSSTGPAVLAHFQILQQLGHGGMGVVYHAWDTKLHRDVAVKTLAPALPVDAAEAAHLEQRFHLEAQVLAQLKHPHIVPVYEIAVHAGQPFFVMELIAGGNLAECLPRMTAAGPAAIVPFVETVARAVAYAHEQGVLHRDLKPANILLTPDGAPRITDFGLAKLFARGAEATEDEPVPSTGDTETGLLTVPGFQPGTAAYMAPEQFDPARGGIGPATDIWAIGVILYELLTGVKPFGTGSREQLRTRVLTHAPAAPRSLCRTLAPRLEAIVLRCLAKNPADRYPSAAALADALARYRRPRWGFASAATVASLAVLTALAWALFPDSDPERRYERAVAPLLAQLQRDEAIDLIPPGQALPPYRIRCGEAATRLTHTADGLTITSSALTLIEFLPRVPTEAYRIVLEIRHDNNRWRNQGPAGVGAVFSAAHLATPAGDQHVAGVFTFDDWGSDRVTGPAQRPLRAGTAQLKLLWYLDGPKENALVPFKVQETYPNPYLHRYASPAEATAFNTLTLLVEPDSVHGCWGDADGPRLGPVRRPLLYNLLALDLRRRQPECANLDLPPLDRPCVGVLISGSTCTIRRLLVQPLVRNPN